jgi:hypothetical protein
VTKVGGFTATADKKTPVIANKTGVMQWLLPNLSYN